MSRPEFPRLKESDELYFASVLPRAVAKELIAVSEDVQGVDLRAYDLTQDQIRLASDPLSMVSDANRPDLTKEDENEAHRLKDEVLLVTRADTAKTNSAYQRLARPILAAAVLGPRYPDAASVASDTPYVPPAKPGRRGPRGPYKPRRPRHSRLPVIDF